MKKERVKSEQNYSSNDYRRLTILVVGDIMLDHYIITDVDRTSPEAPVAVALVKNEDYVIGGAANVAANLKAMGASVILAGATGDDDAALNFMTILKEKEISSECIIEDKNRSTTLKTRILSQGQQLIRIDREKKDFLSDKTTDKIIRKIKKYIPRVDGVIISDYAKGVCTPDVIKNVIDMAKEKGIPVICDPKGQDFKKYRGADVLTPNLKEVFIAAGMETGHDSLEAASRKIMRQTGVKALAVTRGDQGVSLFSGRKKHMHIPAHAREVYDVTGGGDTFISHFALAYVSGKSPEESARLGNFAGSIVVGKLGVAVVTPEELSRFIRSRSFGTKFITLDNLKTVVQGLRAKGKKVVFTNGCFDLIHVGHIKFLEAARALGDCLVVGINTDDSVREIKGPGRPLINESERADLLAALHFVDYVILFDETTPEPLLRSLKPDILVKGKNLKSEEVVGHDLVKSYGGEIRLLPFFADVSTKDRLNEIFQNIRKQSR